MANNIIVEFKVGTGCQAFMIYCLKAYENPLGYACIINNQYIINNNNSIKSLLHFNLIWTKF